MFFEDCPISKSGGLILGWRDIGQHQQESCPFSIAFHCLAVASGCPMGLGKSAVYLMCWNAQLVYPVLIPQRHLCPRYLLFP